MGSGVNILARKIRLASYGSGGEIMNYTIAYFIVWIECFSSEKHFSFLSMPLYVTLVILQFLLEIFQQSTICNITKSSAHQAQS